MFEQTIWLSARVTAFTAVCEACADDCRDSEGWLASSVEGRLRLDQDHGSLSCSRGHVLRVERARRPGVALGAA
jgi:hypothetical protein